MKPAPAPTFIGMDLAGGPDISAEWPTRIVDDDPPDCPECGGAGGRDGCIESVCSCADGDECWIVCEVCGGGC